MDVVVIPNVAVSVVLCGFVAGRGSVDQAVYGAAFVLPREAHVVTSVTRKFVNTRRISTAFKTSARNLEAGEVSGPPVAA